MPERSFTDEDRVEPGAFNEYVFGVFGNTAMQSSKYTSNAHGSAGIADHQVILVQLSFFFIEGYKSASFRQCFYNDGMVTDGIIIKSMKRLPGFMLYEIGDVHNIIDRSEPDAFQSFLQPFW